MSQGIIDQLTSAFKVYSANPNAAKQAVAAAAQGQPIGPKGLAAAAALQQAPQAQAPAPQGTVMQHLAQQQGIMGQLPAMQGQLPPAQPQPEPEMGMAGGGLVSFAQGGVIPPDVLEAIQEHFAQGGAVRGFPTGGSLQALSKMIPDAPGYYESGDILSREDEKLMQELLREQDTATRARLEEEAARRGLRGERSSPSAYQQRAGMVSDQPEPTQGRATPKSIQGLSEADSATEMERLNRRLKWQNLDKSVGYELPKEPPPAKAPRGMDTSKLSKEAREFLSREIPQAEKLAVPEAESLATKLGKAGRIAGKFGRVLGPVGVAMGAWDMYDTLGSPQFRDQYVEDWKEYMPSWMGGKAAPQEEAKEVATPPRDEDYSDIMRGEAGELFPSAGLGSLKQEGKQAGKQEPTTGASVTPRAEPTPEAKKAGYSTPEEQTIKTNSQAAPAATETSPQGASSLMPGESYGIPSIGGLGDYAKMLDEARGLSDAKMSDAQNTRLKEMKTGAMEDKWLGALMGMISGTFGSSSPYLGQAIGEGGIQALSAYQQGARGEADIARKAYDIYGEEEKAPQLEHARNVDTILKLLQQKAEMGSAERIAAGKGGMSLGEKMLLQDRKDAAAKERAELMSGKTNAAIEHAALQQAVADYNAARDKGENPNFDQILTKARVQYGLTPLGLGGGELGGGGLGGGLTVTRQGVRQ
jgi:hypothetical protein